MEYEIDQFVSEQREAAELDGGRDRERHRDRDRRRDRDRERDRDSRRRHRETRDRRDRPERDRDRRSYEGDYSRSRDRQPYERDRGYDDDYGEDYTRYMGSYDSYGSSSSQYDNQSSHDDPDRDTGYLGDSGSYSSSRLDRHPSREAKAADKWITDSPTNTVILKGLSSAIDDKDVRGHLMMTGTPVREVRLVRDKVTGASRGFAFVEFQSVGDAQQWMEQNQGELHLLDQYRVSMYYSTPKRDGVIPERVPEKHPVNPLMGVIGDWICSKCGVHNFKRREHCFKCNISRDESERGKESDGYDQVGHNPCNTLILRGLDALTTEDSLTTAISKVTLLPLKNLKVMRDEKTGISKSFAFVEMNTIADSTQLLETVNKLHGAFEVDGKIVMVNYAKNTFTTIMATQSSQFYGQEYSQAAGGGYYGEDGQYYDASYYDQYGYSQYYSQEGTPASTAATSGSTQTDSTNAAAAVAQAAINKAQAAKALQKQQESMQKHLLDKLQQPGKGTKSTQEDRMKHQASQWAENQQPAESGNGEAQEYAQYPEPDVSTYQYDESSGYYYDSTTGLYYDANSQYYYNSTTGQFMYWDGEKKTYLPAPADQQPGGDPLAGDKDKDRKENKKDKVKVAKKIAKDMEKWAKTLNSQKEAQRDAFRKMFQPTNQQQKKEAAAADAGFAILEKSKRDEFVMPPPPAPGSAVKKAEKPGLVASYGGDSDNDETEEDNQSQQPNGQFDESKLTDPVKMACLLCKRQFPSQEALQRHQQLSDLHKKNLEDLRKSQGSSTSSQEQDSIAQTIQYRDRAKERREKYGAPAPPVPKKNAPKFSIPFEQPTKQGLTQDNKGNKLLQKMGWNEGQGLGKSGQGMVDPIQAARRTQGAGLGALGSRVNIEDSDSYKDACRKTMMARFQDME